MLGNTFAKVLGVELLQLGDGRYSCCFLELHRKGDELEIVNRKKIEGSFVKVLEILPRELPIALVLSGKGIIHKNLSIDIGEVDDTNVFRQAFPAIEVKDFYIQHFSQGEQMCLSITRRETVNELLDKLKRAGLEIYSISFGGLVTTHIWPQLNMYGDELIYAGHHFVLTEKQFWSYSFSSDKKAAFVIKIGQEPIDEEMLAAYAAAFQLVLHERLSMIAADVSAVNEAFQYSRNNAQWKKGIFVFLFGLFALLLLSFGIFSHYNKENEQLIREVGAQTSNAEQTELLQQNIIKQEQLLKQLRWNGGYNYGFLLNEIGRSLPRQLTLLQVAMNDFGNVKNIESIKNGQENTDRVPNIKIKGFTDNLTAVNNWIFVLREKTWVKSAKLLKFQENQEGNNYQFDILISY